MVTPQHFSSGRFISYIIHLRGLGICSMFCDETTVDFSVVSSLIESCEIFIISEGLRLDQDGIRKNHGICSGPLRYNFAAWIICLDHQPHTWYSCEWFVHRSLWVWTSDSVDVQVHGHTDRNIIHQNQRAIGRCPFVGTHLERILHHLDRFYSWM